MTPSDQLDALHTEWVALQAEYEAIHPGVAEDDVYKRMKAITARQREITNETTRIALEAIGPVKSQRTQGAGNTMNVNDTVSVVLTEAGAQHLGREMRAARAGDRLTMPLWELMALFGSAFPKYPSMGHPLPFENNTITLKATTP